MSGSDLPDENNNNHSADPTERRLLVRGVLCLSVLGLIAFIVTRQVTVVVAMNAPLLAIIGKGLFVR